MPGVGYCRMVTISTDNLLATNEFRSAVAADSTSGCASATAAANPTADMSGRSGVSSTMQAQDSGSTPRLALRSRSASTLSVQPCSTRFTCNSRMRAVTAAERRPLTAATSTPPAISSLIPCPSRTLNTFSASPRAPKYRRPSVSTPSTSSTRSRILDNGVGLRALIRRPRAADRAR